MSEDKRTKAIKLTGQMMLQGWRLLAESCPICYTALLASKEGEMRCPYCDLPVVFEQSVVSQEGNNNNNQIDDEELDQFEADLPSSLEDLRKEYESRNSKTNNASQLLGEKMLQGWTMLSDICPSIACKGTPLVRLGKAPAAMLCVSCNRNYLHNETGEIVVEGSKEENSNDTIAQTSRTEHVFSFDDAPILNLQTFSNKNDSSQKISQKLIKGWALLDKCCTLSNCSGNIPLLRDKEEKIYCVECGYVDQMPVVNANSLDEDDDEEETKKISSKLEKITFDVLCNSSRRDECAPTSQLSASLAGAKVINHSQLLKNKLDYASGLLEKETNIEKLTQIAVLIAKLAEAIGSLEKLT